MRIGLAGGLAVALLGAGLATPGAASSAPVVSSASPVVLGSARGLPAVPAARTASGAAVAAAGTGIATADAVGATGPGVRVVAVGDIANPGGPYARTAALAAQLDPARVLLAGDIAYPSGSLAQLRAMFDPTWGQFRDRWLAVPGNHEYRTKGAAGYRAYFGESGGLWWSRKVGDWRVIGLDSERVGSSAQRAWLQRTLRKHDGEPTLVMWHRPRYSRGEHSDQADTARLYRVVAKDRDVRILLWGHDHDYERMTPPVARRSTPLTAFVVGTGGAEQRTATTHPDRTWSRSFTNDQYGVLDLRLASQSFSWAFVTLDGQTLDAGSQAW